jgi:hypothetical protein
LEIVPEFNSYVAGINNIITPHGAQNRSLQKLGKGTGCIQDGGYLPPLSTVIWDISLLLLLSASGKVD